LGDGEHFGGSTVRRKAAVKMTPVRRVDWCVCARCEEAKERVGLCTAGLWPAFLNLGLVRTSKTKGNVNCAGRRPAVQKAEAKTKTTNDVACEASIPRRAA